MTDSAKIIAVIVTYNPSFDQLGRLIDRCVPQVDKIVIADNGDDARTAEWLHKCGDDRIFLLPMGQNKGIAAAQNAGIAWARGQGADYVLIFDHDSEPPPDLAEKLLKAFGDLAAPAKKIAAVGPRYIDTRRKELESVSPFVRFEGGRLRRCDPVAGNPFVPVDFLISSGSLIAMRALNEIGLMEEGLFIDYVDVEWCLRARQSGWELYGVWDAVMEHNLGDHHVHVGRREIAVHSALRHYYLIRNATWLVLWSRLLGRWKFTLAHNALKKFAVYSVIMPQPLSHFRYMCLGLWHGITKRMGKL